ncbi:MAG TPA: hypothetical protein VJT72_20500, partial [Pseudonocardiaceae bacterium]|nr:hypothetical protein [Pseudonocardiaceae bacterium]
NLPVEFAGLGYLTTGDVALAVSAAHEHANDAKQRETPPDANDARDSEGNSHSGRVRGLTLRTATEVVQRGGGHRSIGLRPFQDQTPDSNRPDSLTERRRASQILPEWVDEYVAQRVAEAAS